MSSADRWLSHVTAAEHYCNKINVKRKQHATDSITGIFFGSLLVLNQVIKVNWNTLSENATRAELARIRISQHFLSGDVSRR